MSKKSLIILGLSFSLLALTGAGCGKKAAVPSVADRTAAIKQTIQTLADFKASVKDYNVSQLKETGDWYYYAKDGKRYVFATKNAYISWFGDQDNGQVVKKEEMSKSPLGGQAGFKPGSLLITESDPKIYLVTGGGEIRPITETLLFQLYGADWHASVINIENWFFTAYHYGKPIETISDFPDLPAKPSLEDNLIRP